MNLRIINKHIKELREEYGDSVEFYHDKNSKYLNEIDSLLIHSNINIRYDEPEIIELIENPRSEEKNLEELLLESKTRKTEKGDEFEDYIDSMLIEGKSDEPKIARKKCFLTTIIMIILMILLLIGGYLIFRRYV